MRGRDKNEMQGEGESEREIERKKILRLITIQFI